MVDKLSATFFRLPHQGLNDKAINVAITHLYEALCPDFSYLAPRLRMSEPPLPPPSQLLSRLEPLQNGALDFTGGKRKKIEQGRREQEGQQGSEQREKQNLVIPDVLQNKSNHYRVAFVSSHFFRHSIGNMLIEIMYRMKTDAKSAGFGHLELFAFFMTDPSRPQEDELTAAFAELLQGNVSRERGLSSHGSLYMCLWVCICVCMCLYVSVYICLCVCICVYVSVCIRMCLYVFVCRCVSICVKVCQCVCQGVSSRWLIILFSTTYQIVTHMLLLFFREDNFVRISLSNIQQMRRALGSEEYNLDVIIFADVGMEMHSVILANSRLAPLQVCISPFKTSVLYCPVCVSNTAVCDTMRSLCFMNCEYTR